jgi:hypothetical protein
MKFGITVVSNTPLTPIMDIDEVAITFLEQIGYLPKGYGPRTSTSNIIKSMDLLEDLTVEDNYGQKKKAYRIKYGDLSKAWNFVEAHVAVAIENYRKTVNHLQYLSEKERR